MKAKITIKRQNSDYDPEYAKVYHFGRESESNMKDEWSYTLGIAGNVVSIEIRENTSFEILDYTINNLTIFEYKTDNNEIAPVIISTSLISKIHKAGNSKYKSSHLYIYLKQTNEYFTIGENVLIACEDLPKALEQYLVLN